MGFRVYYGAGSKYKDVTHLAVKKLLVKRRIVIPGSDARRLKLFGDPARGVEKVIRVKRGRSVKSYPAGKPVVIRLPPVRAIIPVPDPVKQLQLVHQKLRFTGGSLRDEFPEQVMIMSYVKPSATVLELGSNIGRSTCIIASILTDSSRLVTLECDPNTVKILDKNRKLNDFRFHIVNAALSKVKLAQKGWSTVEYTDKVPTGFTPIKTLTFTELKTKYPLDFDTLVADCEGALCPILRDEPDILNGIQTLIVENDYTTVKDKLFVDDILSKRGFKLHFSTPGPAGVRMPCIGEFYQVFKHD